MASNSDDSQHQSEGQAYDHHGRKDSFIVGLDDSIEEGQLVEQTRGSFALVGTWSGNLVVGSSSSRPPAGLPASLGGSYRCGVRNEPLISEVRDEPVRERLNLGVGYLRGRNSH